MQGLVFKGGPEVEVLTEIPVLDDLRAAWPAHAWNAERVVAADRGRADLSKESYRVA